MRVFAVLILIMMNGPLLAAEPTEESLLAAWESAQRADPEVQTLEATGDRRYRFETSHFNYTGPLEVTDVVVDHVPGDQANAIGYIQVVLPELSDETMQRRAHSYSRWNRSHTLYWSSDDEQWLTANRWSERIRHDYSGPSYWGLTRPLLIFLVAIALLYWFSNRHAKKHMADAMKSQEESLHQQNEAMELTREALKRQKESNELLREIRDELKRR